jgi:hypothetical protein
VTRGDVNYAQTAMAQTNGTINEDSLVVGSAMRDYIAHTLKHTPINLPSTATGERYAANATHKAIDD